MMGYALTLSLRRLMSAPKNRLHVVMHNDALDSRGLSAKKTRQTFDPETHRQRPML